MAFFIVINMHIYFSYVVCDISHNFPHYQITEGVKFTSFYALLNWHLYFSIAIATVVTIAEILKNNGLAVEKSEFL